MFSIGILLGVVGLAIASFRNLLIPIVGAVVAVVAVPEVAVWSAPLPVVGGVNIGVLVVVATATIQLALRPTRYLADIAAAPAIWTAAAVWVAGGAITNFLAAESMPAAWIEVVLAPPLAYLLLQRLAAERPRALRSVARAIVLVAAAEAVLALSMWAGAVSQPFADAHATFSYWWSPDFPRALGTMDHPLGLAGLMLVATALLQTIERNALVIGLGALFLVTAVAAEARAALVLAIVAFIVALIRRRVAFVTTLALVGAASAAVVAVLVAAPDLLGGLTEKLTDDNGSANARLIGLTEGLPSTLANPIVGGGHGAGIDAARDLGFGTSFENPTVMTAIDWGLVPGLAFIVAQGCALVRGARAQGLSGETTAGIAFAISLQTFSSYALPSGTATLLWIVLGLSIAPVRSVARRPEAIGVTR